MNKDKKHKLYDLSGEWALSVEDTGAGTLEQSMVIFNERKTIPCKVPGDVHIALTDAGIMKDPLIDINSEECRWAEKKEFWYTKTFNIDENFIQDFTQITFEGLDLTADIWMNNQLIGSHNNAFIGKTFDISSNIKIGTNILIVRIDDGVSGVKDESVELMDHSWNKAQPHRALMRKPQFVYGWDWTIWLPTCGIWKGVHIDSYYNSYIKDVYVQTQFEGDQITISDKINLSIDIDIELLKKDNYILECMVYEDSRYDDTSNAILTSRKEIVMDKLASINCNMKFDIKSPKLWWPNKSGLPYLYHIVVEIQDKSGNVIDSLTRNHGLRTVSIDQQELGDNQRSFTFKINGTLIFAKGANHVPADCLIGRITDEKNRLILEATADANMNMIRVWGGGIYESEGFMGTCDELGIMVWHDFMFACGYYPDHDPKFYEEIRIEATSAITRLRNHVSLIGWSGNNEIQEMYLSAKENFKDLPWYGGRIYEELLPSLVKSLCIDRIYRESSPFGGPSPSSFDEGDQHTWHFTHRPNWEHYLDLWRFTDLDYKFLSEFGIIGAMNIESTVKCIKEKSLNPDSPEWLHHTNTTSDHKLLNMIVNKYFGDYSKFSMQEYILKSQVVQAEIMRHIYDELRSRKFRCSGILLWTLSDSFGVHNWSVIDYYLGKRPVYYYLKRSMAPFGLALNGYEAQNFDGMASYKEYYKGAVSPIEITIMNDTLEEKDVLLEYRILKMNGNVLKKGEMVKMIKANSVLESVNVDFEDIIPGFIPEETFMHAQISCNGELLNENRYFFAPYSKLKLENVNIKYSANNISNQKVEILLQAKSFVWMLHISTPDGVIPSDNDFDLIPGDIKCVEIEVENALKYFPIFNSLNPGITVELVYNLRN